MAAGKATWTENAYTKQQQHDAIKHIVNKKTHKSEQFSNTKKEPFGYKHTVEKAIQEIRDLMRKEAEEIDDDLWNS